MIILQPEKKENQKVFEAKIKSLTIIVAATLLSISAFAQVGGTVVDQADGSPVAGAAVTIKGNQAVWDVTDSLGRFKLKATGGTLQITCLGYKTLTTAVRKDGRYSLAQDSFAINEVVVTATESHGLTSSSRIGQDAIAHIQPSSFADLLELLPGGRSVDPSFSTPKTIDLRAVSVSGDNYNTSSLGTRFLIDGVPVNNDANLQTTPAYSNYGSSFVNAGVDMRTITTEDVESVEIIRGIPSVEYGDLTSGLVNIKRRKGGNDTRARFKADMKSKLFYLGKDLEWGKTDKLTMNFSGNFLDSRADPRNTRQNYKRLTGSYRIGKTWTGELVRTLSGSLDYTGSFDNQKSDKNLDFGDCGPIETYKSNYSRFALGGEYTVRSKSLKSFFQSLDITGSLTYEKDLIDRWKFVEYSSPMPLSTSLEEGEFDVTIVPYKYEATLGRKAVLCLPQRHGEVPQGLREHLKHIQGRCTVECQQELRQRHHIRSREAVLRGYECPPERLFLNPGHTPDVGFHRRQFRLDFRKRVQGRMARRSEGGGDGGSRKGIFSEYEAVLRPEAEPQAGEIPRQGCQGRTVRRSRMAHEVPDDGSALSGSYLLRCHSDELLACRGESSQDQRLCAED